MRWPLQSVPGTLLLAVLLALPTMIPATVPHVDAASSQADLVGLVNPFIGTGSEASGYDPANNGGNVFPGAAFPRGMVQFSPDTTTAAGGYRYAQSRIIGFSLTHFSGRGCAAYLDIPIMPTTAPITASPAVSSAYSASYSHADEAASPGYYHVGLGSTSIGVDLTVTPRTGFGIFTFPRAGSGTLLINTGGSANGNRARGTGVQIVSNTTVSGSASSGGFCGQANTYTVYFVAVFSRPFANFGVWNGATVTAQGRASIGAHSGAFMSFATNNNSTVQLKVGISFVSTANARDNLQRENPGWDFGSVRRQAAAAWNTALNRIQSSGGSVAQRTIFYTALYHTLFHPNIFSDANGQYLGFDQRVHTAQGYTQYDNFPGWDMYRSLIGLDALLEPQAVGDMVTSLTADAQQGGGGLPRWEVANDNSNGMVGDSQDAVIATAYALGVRNFDAHAALTAMIRGASDPAVRSGTYHPREGLSDYLRLGYVPGSASITQEYAADDFAISQFAAALGDKSTATTFAKRAIGWRQLWDPKFAAIEPRDAQGAFIDTGGLTNQNGFTEGDSAQYTWMVPFDLPWLIGRMGGNTATVRRLDQHFTQLNAGPGSPFAFMGNEPEFGAPWIYDFAQAPDHTQAVVRRIVNELFAPVAGGLPGNDDGGALSSWYIFATLGLYPAIPGAPGFVLGSPLFPSAVMQLGNGNQLRIIASSAASNAPYVSGLTLNDRAYSQLWLPYSSIAQGGTLSFALSTRPQSWGKTTASTPQPFATSQDSAVANIASP